VVKLVKLISTDGKDIYVNPEQVVCVHQADPNGAVTIAPVTGYAIKLKGDLQSVVGVLRGFTP
jgi:hypothetical protein